MFSLIRATRAIRLPQRVAFPEMFNYTDQGYPALGLGTWSLSDSFGTLGTVTFCISALITFVLLRTRGRTPALFPPGPKPLPLIGNALDMPADNPCLQYDRWIKQYGDIVHLEIMGKHIVILGSERHILELLAKRSSIYSSRPRFPMLNELMGFDYVVALQREETEWRKHRRLFNKYFRQDAAHHYKDVQVAEVHTFMRRLISSSDEFMDHIRYLFGSSTLRIMYGLQTKASNDPHLEMAEESISGLLQGTHPGRFLVDIFPSLKYVPSWMPGAGFRRQAKHFATLNKTLLKAPYEWTKAQGQGTESIVTKMISELPEDPKQRAEAERMAMNVAATAYIGGADTTIASMQWFILAMAMYPEVQRKAQAELDRVIGSGPERLPDFHDQESLPYIKALIMELLRWHPAGPGGLPHSCNKDDVYKGFFIPKDTIIIPNVWTLTRDPVMYPDPENFDPERFLLNGQINAAVKAPQTFAFGFGQRICPGRYHAENSLWITVACVLSVFTIGPSSEDDAEPLQARMIGGVISCVQFSSKNARVF